MAKKPRVMIYPAGMDINKVLQHNGIVLDNICTSLITDEELSPTGNYFLDATFLNDKDLVNNIAEQCILKILMDYGYEIFQLKKPKKGLKYVTVVAYQYTIPQQKSMWLDDIRPTNVSGQGALTHILNNSTGNKRITMNSNITISGTAYYELKTVYEALYDSDNSFINIWGGNGIETLRRGTNVTMNTSVGGDKQLSIREGKNLKDFADTRDLESYVTRAIGKGFNGIKGHYIDSPLIDNYPDIHTDVFEYSNVKLRAEDMTIDSGDVVFDTLEEVQAELDRLVGLEYSKNNIDKVMAEYTLDYAKLEDTEEYKINGYDKTEKANIGDYVKVYIPSLKYDLVVRVIKKQFDVLRQKTKNIKLSSYPISGTLSSTEVTKNIQQCFAKSGLKGMSDFISSMINAGLQNSHAIIRPNEILMLDTTDINTSKNTWRWNAGALAHSSKGYYSDEWNIGITQDGQINASMMTTGVLSAILIKALEDSSSKMYIDLSTGTVYMDKGRIGSNSFYIDITEQKIIGKDMEINLVTGEVKTKHGKFGNDTCYYDVDNQIIYGLKTLLKLAEGIYSFADGNVVIDNEKGIEIKKGKVGNDTCYFDIGNQIIRGDRFYIDLKSGGQNLIEAGNISSQNGRTNICMTDGTAKIGAFSVSHDNKVNVEDGSFTAKSGDKYCKIESGQVSWNDGSRLINNNKHTVATVTGTKEIESLDIIGNTDGGVTLSSKAADAIINANSGSVYLSYNKKNEFYADDYTWIAGNPNGIHVSGSAILNTLFITSPKTEISGDLSVGGDKNCIQSTESFGKVKFSSVEDIGAYLTWREYDAFKEQCIYETKLKSYSKDGYCSCIVKIPKIIQECIDTSGNYNVDINVVKSFANARLWSINKEYFLVKSDKPCRFNFVLTGRRKGFEGRSVEEQILEGELYKSTLERLELKRRADIKLRFKKLGSRPNYPLWEKCAREWEDCGECYEG